MTAERGAGVAAQTGPRTVPGIARRGVVVPPLLPHHEQGAAGPVLVPDDGVGVELPIIEAVEDTPSAPIRFESVGVRRGAGIRQLFPIGVRAGRDEGLAIEL